MNKSEENFGLTSYEALGILHEDIQKLLSEYAPKYSSRWDCLKDILDYRNELSRFSWVSAICIVLASFSLILTSFFTNVALYGNLTGHGIFILAIGILNVLLVSWDNQLRCSEIPDKINDLLIFLKECQKKCYWRPENYPHLCSPFSPCITLQWTYRDNRLVNLPWALLCKGDVIMLRPGQAAPGNLIQQENHSSFLAYGDVYSPPQKHETINVPTARIPFKNKRFILTETPLLRNIKDVLDANLQKNCVTSFDKQIHMLMTKCIQNIAVPLILISTILLGLLRTVYVDNWIGNGHWTVTFLLTPSCIMISLLPICFPACWIALHTLGNAKLSAFLQSSSTIKTADPFEDVSIDEEKVEDIVTGVKWSQHFIHALLGKQHSLTLARSSNPLHILGSVTALCCVDKKGILSWPNPTAEKIFFMKTVDKTNLTRNTTIDENVSDVYDADEILPAESEEVKTNEVLPSDLCTRVEVLDLTHDLSCPFKLQFDDTRWSEHLGSLKPIGLAILLNTCNMATQEHYVQFCSHVTCEALYNEDLVPVTNRRCLCELAKQIGFTENAKNSFYLLEQLSTFRHVQPETVRKDIKFARSLALATKLKLPFPHMVAVVTVEATIPNSLQMFSQATGDIALDSCVDFWDGNTLRTLTSSDRKKILDFYQRTSLTAYCTAFAYRPLGRPVNSDMTKIYMELPADSHLLYLKNRSPTPIERSLRQTSVDCLTAEEVAEEVNDIEGCFEMQCNQIFLGMVTMQYQAQIEMVHLIEQLERACIRFVHFSKENELRSRVFSEKMGLESGWNCHISLLSSEESKEELLDVDLKEDDWERSDAHAPLLSGNQCSSLEGSRAMSVSAPCAINTETSANPDYTKSKVDEFEVISQEGWQSLSCLTDSTEQSAPINFDMSNRAKLPRGIEQIRPHLEQVDNVPLLVSLFTDCIPSTTQQMLDIMKDYGEIVCVMGSSANADNSSIFLRANVSVSVEPLFPQVCQKVPVYSNSPDAISPVQLSGRLNSLPCCVSITRQRPVSLFHLIMHARHYMMCLWNCLQFWICCMFTLTMVQMITIMVMLPPLFSAGQTLWLSCVVLPLLSISLVNSPTNTQVMLRPVPKKQSTINSKVVIFVAWCYGTKFVLTIMLIPLIYGATLASFCPHVAAQFNQTCLLVYPVPGEPLGGWESNYIPLKKAQMIATSLIVFHFAVISVSFIHRESLSWRRSPFKNKTWCVIVFGLLLIQSISAVLSIVFDDGPSGYDMDTSWCIIITAALSPILIFLLNEFVKWQEIKANLRYEKRARLDFGTKLGMNSPF
ncbi:unnamed protein product [Nezara viridula]|uniref:Transmembrane protein 94 n=1 Tax=Nezara viridula TaxID=85310 RepID=A0A9P0GZ64_NEZVI|nr:unnamed protein product [Nezara viridula]